MDHLLDLDEELDFADSAATAFEVVSGTDARALREMVANAERNLAHLVDHPEVERPPPHEGLDGIEEAASELEVSCLPADLPEFIEVDLSDLKKGMSLHLSDVKLPKGVTAVTHGKKDPVVVSVAVVGGEEATEAAAAADGAAAAAPAAGDAKAAAAPAKDAKAAAPAKDAKKK